MRRLLGSTTIRTAVVAAVVAMLVAFPLGVLANHQFTDVPNSNTFHGDIDHVYDARITAGCTATTYCPDDNVSRGQMAAFLERSGGRATTGTQNFVFTIGATAKSLGTITIRAGNVTGGTAFILLQATGYVVSSNANETGCNTGCAFVGEIRQGATKIGNFGAGEITNTSATDSEFGAITISTVVSVPTGVDQTYNFVVYRYAGSGTASGLGNLTAQYSPFGAKGGDTLTGASVSEPVAAPLQPDGQKK
jgi:hypothetical protein